MTRRGLSPKEPARDLEALGDRAMRAVEDKTTAKHIRAGRRMPIGRSPPSLGARTLSPLAAERALALRHVGPSWQRVREALTDDELTACEHAVGLVKPNSEFRDGIADAIFLGLCLVRQVPPKTARAIRAEHKAVAKRAEAAAAIDQLRDALGAMSSKLIGEDVPPAVCALLSLDTTDWLRDLAYIALAAAASVPPGKLGAPRRSIWLDIRLRRIADAYGHATGTPATVTTDEGKGRYGGLYFALIEQVLPIAAEIIGDPRIARRTNAALGKRMQRAFAQMERQAASKPRSDKIGMHAG